jgi:DNA-directed RNA polymerase III subunit RPC4
LKKEEPIEVYSDPEDGVEIIDIEQVGALDWMAPDVLRKGLAGQKFKAKKEEDGSCALANPLNPNLVVACSDKTADALDLDEQESEEDSEDLIEHFSSRNLMEIDDVCFYDRSFSINPYFYRTSSPSNPKSTSSNSLRRPLTLKCLQFA